MAKRIFSTVLLWLIVLGCCKFFGATGAIWLVAVISVLTLKELYAMVRRMGLQPFDGVGLALAAMITLAPLYFERWVSVSELLALAVIVFAVRVLGERDSTNRVESLAWSMFGVFYVPFLLHFMVRVLLIKSPHELTGLTFSIWLIAVSKFCDVGALLSGMAFGRHKMAPVISPKKTWEGAVGGVIVSAGIGALVAWLGRSYLPVGFTPGLAAVCAVPIAVIAVVSDLIESVIKRRADTKDAGQTIPGIGGVFDLSDSLILTAPLGYTLFRLF